MFENEKPITFEINLFFNLKIFAKYQYFYIYIIMPPITSRRQYCILFIFGFLTQLFFSLCQKSCK